MNVFGLRMDEFYYPNYNTTKVHFCNGLNYIAPKFEISIVFSGL